MESNITRQQSYTIRGIAIILLLLHHYSGMEFSLHSFQCFKWTGAIVCAVFFFFSGYSMNFSLSKMASREYIIRRILTLYVPFLLINAFFFIYFVYFKHEIFGTLDSVLFLSGIKILNGHTWFLQVLIILTLCCFTFYKHCKTLIISLLIGGGYLYRSHGKNSCVIIPRFHNRPILAKNSHI